MLPGESEAEWNALRDATLRRLAPQDAYQTALAERAALSLWRLQRTTRYETSATIAAYERAPEDAAIAINLIAGGFDSRDALINAIEDARRSDAALPGQERSERAATLEALLARLDAETERLRTERAIFPPDDVARKVQRYEAHFQRQYNAAVKELRLLQASSRPVPPTPREITEQFPTPGNRGASELPPVPVWGRSAPLSVSELPSPLVGEGPGVRGRHTASRRNKRKKARR